MQWYVGMKVVCVDDQWRPYNPPGWPLCPLEKGKVYTIFAIHTGSYGRYEAPTRLNFCVELVEVVNPFDLDGDYKGVRLSRGFNAGRFRPVAKKKTDISVFTRMLKEDKKLVDA